jgi:molecular chaperone HscC
MTRAAFEAECAPLLRRLRAPVERALGDAALSSETLDAVILVGGATRMPMIRSLVARLFGKLPLITVDPDTTVALGAAVQAGLKARAAALEDMVMTDVCPFTLGIKVLDTMPGVGSELRVRPIIERNAVVPISRSDIFLTVADNQTAIDVEVYQGENIRPEHNVRLGSIKLNVPRARAGEQKIDVRFTYDINGALEVGATVLATGQVHTRVFRNESGLSDSEIEQRFKALAAIKMHPREQAENKALITRAERIYAEQRGPAREVLLEMLGAFKADIVRQSVRDQGGLRAQFAAALDQLERTTILGD